jgi:NADH:ubiquinone oxidoreductase subunit E
LSRRDPAATRAASPEALTETIVARYENDAGMLIPMMQDLQAECGYLPAEHLRRLAARLKVPLSRVYGVATFYASFRLMPKGEHTVTLCLGTVCYLKGANRISEAIQQEFQMKPGETSPDGKFTYAPVNCVGACALAPVMIVDGQYHGKLSPDSAVELLRKIAAAAPPEPSGDAGESPPDRTAAAPKRRPRKTKARS